MAFQAIFKSVKNCGDDWSAKCEKVWSDSALGLGSLAKVWREYVLGLGDHSTPHFFAFIAALSRVAISSPHFFAFIAALSRIAPQVEKYGKSITYSIQAAQVL